MQVQDAVELGVTDVVMIQSDRLSHKEIEPAGASGATGETRNLETSVIRGPAMFFPCANQRILELTWRTDDNNGTTKISKLSLASHSLILSGTFRPFPRSAPKTCQHSRAPYHNSFPP